MSFSADWKIIFKKYKKSWVGVMALWILALFVLVGIYAPLLASSKPLLVSWKGQYYFPLLRYLFYKGFYTKPIDLFFNLLMITLPILVLGGILLKASIRKLFLVTIALLHIVVFGWLWMFGITDPSFNPLLEKKRQTSLLEKNNFSGDPLLAPFPSQIQWSFEKQFLASYEELNHLLHYKQMLTQNKHLEHYQDHFLIQRGKPMPTLWNVWHRNESLKQQDLAQMISNNEASYLESQRKLPNLIESYRPFSHAFIMAKHALKHSLTREEEEASQTKLDHILQESQFLRSALEQAREIMIGYQKQVSELHFLKEKKLWLEQESQKVKILIPPLIRFFHWEEDAGGAQEANLFLPWWELTRINRKDLVSSLLFGIRVSLVVGFSAVLIALSIGIPLGIFAGYFAGNVDLIVSRLMEIWEAMPTFFMLLLIVSITQSKSIFLVSAALGIFGWTSMARYMRSEVLKQRKLAYVTACHSLGYPHLKIMFSHILPNAIPPLLTLLPFSMMAAITSEAGLSFLGLGEEGSTSWGVLMDEGRAVFPAESYLLWPPALLLTLLLIAIALVGDRFRDAIDPKTQ